MFQIVTPMIQARPGGGEAKPPAAAAEGLFAEVLADVQGKAAELPVAAPPLSLPALFLGLTQPPPTLKGEAAPVEPEGEAAGEGEAAEPETERKAEAETDAALSQPVVQGPVLVQPPPAPEAPVAPPPAEANPAPEPAPLPQLTPQPEPTGLVAPKPLAQAEPRTTELPPAKGPTFSDLLGLIDRQVEAGEGEVARPPIGDSPQEGQPEQQETKDPGPTLSGVTPSLAGPPSAAPAAIQTFGQALAEASEAVEPPPLTDQVIRSVKVTVEQGQSEMRLQLRPRHLGELGIQLNLVEGNLRAELTVANSQVQQALEANLQQLRDSLAAAGIRVESFSVTVGQQGLGGSTPDQQQPQQQPQQQQRGGEPGPQTHDASHPDEGDADPFAPSGGLRRLNVTA